MNAIRTLERHAVRSHRRGIGWSQFWTEHGAEVCRAEPHDRRKFGRLVRRLLSLLISGNCDGQQPIPVGMLWGEPWEADGAVQEVRG
jgi:hypothetical protein